MSRTLIDIFLSVRYVSNRDTEARAKTYVDYFAKTHEGWMKMIEKHFPHHKNLPMPAFHDRAMETAKQFKGHEWTGLRGQTKIMAFEEDSYEIDAKGQPVKQEFDYDVPYWWTSQYVHATIASLAEHEIEPGRVFRVRSQTRRDTERGYDALFNTAIFLHKIFICAFRGMNSDLPEDLMIELGELVRRFAAAKPRRRSSAES